MGLYDTKYSTASCIGCNLSAVVNSDWSDLRLDHQTLDLFNSLVCSHLIRSSLAHWRLCNLRLKTDADNQHSNSNVNVIGRMLSPLAPVRAARQLCSDHLNGYK